MESEKDCPRHHHVLRGNRKDQERANLIAYLASQSDSPPKLPVASAKPAEAAAKPAAAK